MANQGKALTHRIRNQSATNGTSSQATSTIEHSITPTLFLLLHILVAVGSVHRLPTTTVIVLRRVSTMLRRIASRLSMPALTLAIVPTTTAHSPIVLRRLTVVRRAFVPSLAVPAYSAHIGRIPLRAAGGVLGEVPALGVLVPGWTPAWWAGWGAWRV